MVSDGLKSFLFQKVIQSLKSQYTDSSYFGGITVPTEWDWGSHFISAAVKDYVNICRVLVLSALDKSSIADESNSKNTSGTIPQPLS